MISFHLWLPGFQLQQRLARSVLQWTGSEQLRELEPIVAARAGV